MGWSAPLIILLSMAACRPSQPAATAPAQAPVVNDTVTETNANSNLNRCLTPQMLTSLSLSDKPIHLGTEVLRVQSVTANGSSKNGSRAVVLSISPVTAILPPELQENLQSIYPEFEICDQAQRCMGGDKDKTNSRLPQWESPVPLDDDIGNDVWVKVRICADESVRKIAKQDCGPWWESSSPTLVGSVLELQIQHIDQALRENDVETSNTISALQKPAREYLEAIDKAAANSKGQKSNDASAILVAVAKNLTQANSLLQGAAVTKILNEIKEAAKTVPAPTGLALAGETIDCDSDRSSSSQEILRKANTLPKPSATPPPARPSSPAASPPPGVLKAQENKAQASSEDTGTHSESSAGENATKAISIGFGLAAGAIILASGISMLVGTVKTYKRLNVSVQPGGAKTTKWGAFSTHISKNRGFHATAIFMAVFVATIAAITPTMFARLTDDPMSAAQSQFTDALSKANERLDQLHATHVQLSNRKAELQPTNQ